MAFKPPTYPDTLTKAQWDAKKGAMAKAAGETGVGAAADTAEKAFKKITWTVFDVDERGPQGLLSTLPKRMAELKADLLAEHSKQVKPVIEDVMKLNKAAAAAAKKFKASKTISKDSTKAAETFAVGSMDLAADLALNGKVFSAVMGSWDSLNKSIEDNLKKQADNMKETKTYLGNLLKGLAKLKAQPTKDVWEADVKQHGRSVSNNLKGNPELAKKHLKTWTTKFKGFDLNTMGLSNLPPDQLAAEFDKVIREVATEARTLNVDL